MNVVALHALNPWGFSHRSRTDEANIDLNRNFTDYDQPLAQDELYPILFRAICPDDWTEETIDWTEVRDEIVRVHGAKRMITVLAGGPDFAPTGLAFTVSGPSWSPHPVAEQMPLLLETSKKHSFIEWHT